MRFFLILILFISNISLSQGWEKLYEDNNLTLEVKIKPASIACEAGDDLTKFQYRIKGTLYPNEKYVNWKINYLDCSGKNITKINSIIIGGNLSLTHWNVQDYYIQDELVDKDPDNYLKSVKELIGRPYDISISDNKLNVSEETSSINTTYKGWQKLYEDNNLTLDVKIKVSSSVCDDGGDLTKFQYRIKGNLYNYEKYVNWKINYLDCRGKSITETNSIVIGGDLALTHWDVQDYYIQDELVDKDPDNYLSSAKELRGRAYDISTSDNEVNEREESKVLISELPSEILGSDTIFYGEAVDLFFEDGVLGSNSEWVWYKNSCQGQFVGKGEQITDTPTENTIYYLSVQGPNETKNCIKKYIYIDKKSYEASAITGSNEACKDEELEFQVEGGVLGLGANWIWYEKNGDGRILGMGNTLRLRINYPIRICVRAEGTENKTDFVYFDVKLISKPNKPGSISLMNSNVCQNFQNMAVVTDNNQSNVSYKWYKNDLNSYSIYTGKSYPFSIADKTIFYVRAENKCGVSTANFITLNPMSTSKEVTGVKYIRRGKTVSELIENKKYIIVPTGATVGENATWSWNKNNSYFSNNDMIKVKAKSGTNYSVQLSGTCNKTVPFNFTLNTKPREKWSSFYGEGDRNKQLGFALGYDLSIDEISGKEYITDDNFNQKVNNVKATNSITGYKFQLSYHPIINDYFSFGLFPSVTYSPNSSSSNTTIDLVERNGGKVTNIDSITQFTIPNYSLSNNNDLARSINYKIETELCLGFEGFKLLGKTIHSWNDARYSAIASDFTNGLTSQYNFNQINFNEYLCLGARFGSYNKVTDKKKKRGGGIDFFVSYRRNKDAKYNYNNIFSVWDKGYGVVFWKHSIFKIGILVDSRTTNISINYTFDRFK